MWGVKTCSVPGLLSIKNRRTMVGRRDEWGGRNSWFLSRTDLYWLIQEFSCYCGHKHTHKQTFLHVIPNSEDFVFSSNKLNRLFWYFSSTYGSILTQTILSTGTLLFPTTTSKILFGSCSILFLTLPSTLLQSKLVSMRRAPSKSRLQLTDCRAPAVILDWSPLKIKIHTFTRVYEYMYLSTNLLQVLM